MFLKRIYNLIIIKQAVIYIYIFLISSVCASENINVTQISNYFKNLNEFESSFLQVQNNDVSEGTIFYKKKRIRIEYKLPSNIVFVLKNNKAMYLNIELQEVEYFNPKETIGQFFIDLFNNEDFLLNSKLIEGKGYVSILKEITYKDERQKVEIFFEKSPLQFRKIKIINNEGTITFAILNPNFNPQLNDQIFSLAHPFLNQN